MRIGITDILPTGSNVYTLLDTTTGTTAGLLQNGIRRIAVTIYHDQGGILRLRWSRNRGQTWRTVYNEVMAASTATAVTGPVDFLVDMYSDVQLQWENGGVDQTVFEPEVVGLESRLVGN